MNATTKVKLREISPYLACNLCRGYMIDATTTIECLHSFCKSCIVKHLENSEYCPVCEVQLHSTKPLSGIRSDQMLQEIIFKLVPGLYTREMEQRRKFYKEHPKSTPTTRFDSGKISQQPYITSYDKINISMEYFTDDKNIQEISRKYLQSPAGVSISVLSQWVQGKHELPKDSRIEILYGDRILPHDFLLMDIAYKYSWTESMTKPLQLRYRITNPLLPSILSSLGQSPVKATPPCKRKSRFLTDSEVLKSSNVNSLIPNLTPTQDMISVKVEGTPSDSKGRGRKKRSLVSIKNETPDILKEKVEAKRKRLSNGGIAHFKDMESQCNDTNRGENDLNIPQKEVQLQISESGVISAKSVASGEEKIIGIGQLDSSEKTLISQNPAIIKPVPTKPQINGVMNINGNNYVHLNIPFVNGLTNGTPIPTTSHSNATASEKLSNRNHAGDISLLPKPTQLLTPKKLLEQMAIHGVTKNIDLNRYERKKANMQKAIQDLQRKHSKADNGTNGQITGNNMKQPKTSKGKTSNRNKNEEILSPLVNGHSAVPNTPPQLPFPLSALASSGMTVNLIPSCELKQSSSFVKGKDLQIQDEKFDSASPSPIKKLKHTTTLQNGEIRFSSSRQILPSTSSTSYPSSSGSETSPTKPRKFFKSRQSPDHGISPVKVGESPKSKISSTSKVFNNHASSGKQSHVTSFNGHGPISQQLSPSTDLKLINSTSKTTNTMTTPSRMSSTPTTTAILSNTQQYSANALSQFMQYLNPLQFQLQMGGIPQMNFFPVMAKNYNPLSYFNPTSNRTISESLLSMPSFPQNPSYSMIYTPNQNPVPGLSNGSNHNNTNNHKVSNGHCAPSDMSPTKSQQAKISSLSEKKNGTKEHKNKDIKEKTVANTLDLSLKKKSITSDKAEVTGSPERKSKKSKQNFKFPINDSISIPKKSSPSPQLPKDESNNEIPAASVISSGRMSPAPLCHATLSTVKNGSSSDSGMDSLSSTSEICDKEPDADFSVQNEPSGDQLMNNCIPESSLGFAVATNSSAATEALLTNEPALGNRRYSPEKEEGSNDSTDLVINEDCEPESASPAETNDIVEKNIQESEIPDDNKTEAESDKVEKLGISQINGHDQGAKISENENRTTTFYSTSNNVMKESPVCNNNNNDLHAPSTDSNISVQSEPTPPLVPNN